jgi:hypothetical protein
MRLNSRYHLIVAASLAALLGNANLRADILQGEDIEITSQLDGNASQSATVVDNSDGTQFDSSALNFSWMIPGDYFTFGSNGGDLESFTVQLSGNSTFSSTDTLNLSFTLPAGYTFDPSETALVRAYSGVSGGVSGGTLSFQLTNMDSLSTIDNVNTTIEWLSRVQGPASAPDACSTAVLLAGASVLLLGFAARGYGRRGLAV